MIPGEIFQIPSPQYHNSFLYGLSGSGMVYGIEKKFELFSKEFITFKQNGDAICIQNISSSTWSFLYGSAKPVEESVYRMDNFIENSKNSLFSVHDKYAQQANFLL